jgi:hypothetical protein
MKVGRRKLHLPGDTPGPKALAKTLCGMVIQVPTRKWRLFMVNPDVNLSAVQHRVCSRCLRKAGFLGR